MDKVLKLFLIWLIVFACAFTAGCCLVSWVESTAISRTQAKAAAAGVGAYILNHKTGQIEFQYVDINATIMQVVQQMNAQRPMDIK